MADPFPKLNAREEATLRFICSFVETYQVSPSNREICVHLASVGLGSVKTVMATKIASLLISRGVLAKIEAPSRFLRPTPLAQQWFATQPKGPRPPPPGSVQYPLEL
jgi:hypothetical protein